jgi:hypothetical protein
LLEAVPAREAATLGRQFSTQPIPTVFDDPSREIAIAVSGTASGLAIKGELPKCSMRGVLAIEVRMKKDSFAFLSKDVGKNFELRGRLAGTDVDCHPVLGKKLAGASCWQAWRVAVGASSEPRAFEFALSNRFDKEVVLTAATHFVPE